MFPPVACWPDGAAVTFHYDDMSVRYLVDPVSGVRTDIKDIPKVGVMRIVLWMERTPLLEVSLDLGQRPIFHRIPGDNGAAKAYLVGWQQTIDGLSVQSIGYYLPPTQYMPGRIAVAGEYESTLLDRFNKPDFRENPIPCWPDSTSYSFYYQDGKRLDRIDRGTGEEHTSENLTRVGLEKVTIWHHGIPVIECHYSKGQQAIFRRRNEWRGDMTAAVGHQGVPLDAMLASTNWFANQKAVQEGRYRAFYMLGWKQPIGNKSVQSVSYFYPQNGQCPPRVVLAGKFCEDDDTYLPIPIGKDLEVIT
jgi:hypothetical protein